MHSIVTGAGQSIAGLASTYLKDPSYFREIADTNQWNPIGDSPLPVNIAAKIPTLPEVVPLAQSKLSGPITDTISSLDKVLPTQYRGYTKAALDAIAEVNGSIDSVESTLNSTLNKIDKTIGKVRQYKGDRVRLVDWLLS